MQKYRFDKCFLGANGVHEQLGFTTPDPEEALLKQMALTLANEGYFLIDESKFFRSCVCEKLQMLKMQILLQTI